MSNEECDAQSKKLELFKKQEAVVAKIVEKWEGHDFLGEILDDRCVAA